MQDFSISQVPRNPTLHLNNQPEIAVQNPSVEVSEEIHISPSTESMTELSQQAAQENVSSSRNSERSSDSEDHPSAVESTTKPTHVFKHISSLDNLLNYFEQKSKWKHTSSVISDGISNRESDWREGEANHLDLLNGLTVVQWEARKPAETTRYLDGSTGTTTPCDGKSQPQAFRNFAAEIGFCFTIATTQFLCEYLISGFAIEITQLPSGDKETGGGSAGTFWPASLLSLILSATLLVFARLSDMYGGYLPLMFGTLWVAIWTFIPGVVTNYNVLDISRAMQGLGLAACTPSAFALTGSIYTEGPRRNLVMGLYAGCAPLGFFVGLLTAAGLEELRWYFWVASILSLLAFAAAFMTVPSDRIDRRRLDLTMDWVGAALIVGGLILVSYALAVEPYVSEQLSNGEALRSPRVLGPLLSGTLCLVTAFWYEGWCASCPLLPFAFFKPKNVKALSFACLCFYASYGAWLYESTAFFEDKKVTDGGVEHIRLALWYLPTAIGGLTLCIAGGMLMHLVPIMVMLLVSAIAWIAAPLLLAFAPLPLNYWSSVLPSMICATLGIDMTFTVSIVFISSVQPMRFQGLSGAVCSILVNLAISIALSVSEIVSHIATGLTDKSDGVEMGSRLKSVLGYRAAFVYGAVSAGFGLVVCVLFVRISRYTVRPRTGDTEHADLR